MWWKSSHDLNAKRGPIACTNDQLTLFRRLESADLEGPHRCQVVECPPWRKPLSLPPRHALPPTSRQKFPIDSASAVVLAYVLLLHLNQLLSVDLDVAILSLRLEANALPPNFSRRPDFPSVLCMVVR